MDTLQQLKKVEEVAVKQGKEEEAQSTKHERSTSTAAASAGSLPPSSSSSPSHEFSFTISLHPSNKCKPTPSFDFDLSPADEIFFHGHLLPLHLLSHSSISPRSSTSEALNLPTHQPFDVQKLESSSNNNNDDDDKNTTTTTTSEIKRKIKAKSFSLSKLTKWRKPFETGERWEDKKKLKFEVSRVLKRYAKAVRPFLFFHGGDKEKRETRPQPHSFSGNLNSKWKEWGGKRAGEFSAPASVWTSPTNSGLLVPTAAVSKSNDSTMEELQSAIQAAIAHCKSSIAVKEEKCKF